MLKISLIVWIILGTTLAGICMIAALMFPNLPQMTTIPLAVAAGFIVAIPLSYMIARQISALR
ncbi:MAG: hypothetical protein FWD68_10770 [Alphaproteobacteria bacterium]|nr:hypothetical protein [Alphaproteobacteria bacterium]